MKPTSVLLKVMILSILRSLKAGGAGGGENEMGFFECDDRDSLLKTPLF